jgi:hypothetical protein
MGVVPWECEAARIELKELLLQLNVEEPVVHLVH